MFCDKCGRKPKKTYGAFPKAVIEIDNPEIITLLRKVVIPASMGTEEQVPAAIGKYHNVILHYEANKHTYLYSSDGIPTLLEMDVPQEIMDRIETLEDNVSDLNGAIDDVEQEIEDLKNSPDVVDIVATYADLQAYDTSELGDKDVIRVLADETHDGASAYYRWDKTNSQWIFIGITGPYYTKSEIDITVQGIDNDIDDLQSKIGKAKILTQEDYNYPADNPNSVALWLLDPGTYVVSQGVSARVSNDSVAEDTLYIVTTLGVHGKAILNFAPHDTLQTGPYYGYIYTVSSTGAEFDNRPLNSVIDALDSTYTKRALSANQGKVLNEKIGDLTTLTTTDKTDTVAAINEVNSEIGHPKTLTGADFNWDSVNKSTSGTLDSVALWLLPSGFYKVAPSLDSKTFLNKNGGFNGSSLYEFIIHNPNPTGTAATDITTIILVNANEPSQAPHYGALMATVTNHSDGNAASGYSDLTKISFLARASIKNDLTTTTTGYVLDATQGKELKDLIDALTARVDALEGN